MEGNRNRKKERNRAAGRNCGVHQRREAPPGEKCATRQLWADVGNAAGGAYIWIQLAS